MLKFYRLKRWYMMISTKLVFQVTILVYKLCFKPWDINLSQFSPSLRNKFNNSLNSPFSWLLDLITYSHWATMQCSNQLYMIAKTVINYNLDTIHTHTHTHRIKDTCLLLCQQNAERGNNPVENFWWINWSILDIYIYIYTHENQDLQSHFFFLCNYKIQ